MNVDNDPSMTDINQTKEKGFRESLYLAYSSATWLQVNQLTIWTNVLKQIFFDGRPRT